MRLPAGTAKASSRGRRWGFSLIEMVVVMAALALLMTLVTLTLAGIISSEKLTAGVTQRLMRQQALADQFRADVAGASAGLASWKDWTAGPDCLILRQPGGRHVVYLWRGERLQRLEHQGRDFTARPLPLGSENMTVEFPDNEPGRPLRTLRLLEKRGRVTTWQTEIAAALGGDLR